MRRISFCLPLCLSLLLATSPTLAGQNGPCATSASKGQGSQPASHYCPGATPFQALRYFSAKVRILPALDWTREVAAALIQAARAEVVKLDPEAERPGPAVTFDLTVGKPIEKSV